MQFDIWKLGLNSRFHPATAKRLHYHASDDQPCFFAAQWEKTISASRQSLRSHDQNGRCVLVECCRKMTIMKSAQKAHSPTHSYAQRVPICEDNEVSPLYEPSIDDTPQHRKWLDAFNKTWTNDVVSPMRRKPPLLTFHFGLFITRHDNVLQRSIKNPFRSIDEGAISAFGTIGWCCQAPWVYNVKSVACCLHSVSPTANGESDTSRLSASSRQVWLVCKQTTALIVCFLSPCFGRCSPEIDCEAVEEGSNLFVKEEAIVSGRTDTINYTRRPRLVDHHNPNQRTRNRLSSGQKNPTTTGSSDHHAPVRLGATTYVISEKSEKSPECLVQWINTEI